MQRDADAALSNNEREFIIQARGRAERWRGRVLL